MTLYLSAVSCIVLTKAFILQCFRKWRGSYMNCDVTIDIGVQSFEKIRERNSFYIDKTEFIREW